MAKSIGVRAQNDLGGTKLLPEKRLDKLDFARKINWLPAFFCLKKVHIKKLELYKLTVFIRV